MNGTSLRKTPPLARLYGGERRGDVNHSSEFRGRAVFNLLIQKRYVILPLGESSLSEERATMLNLPSLRLDPPWKGG